MHGTWLGHVSELIKELKYQLGNTLELTVIYKIRTRAMTLLQLIHNSRIQDRDTFTSNECLLAYVEITKKKTSSTKK